MPQGHSDPSHACMRAGEFIAERFHAFIPP
jgi:hypothetical protein